MDRQAHVPAGHRPLRAALHDSPSPAHAPLLCARTWTGRPTSPQGTNHSSLSCMTLLLPLTLLRRAPITPPLTHAAAARTASAPHQRRIRDHGPDRLSTARAGSTLPQTRHWQLAPLHACLAAARTTLALHRQCNRDLGPDRLTLSMHRVLTLTRLRLASLPARPCRASHDSGRPSWSNHDLTLTRP